MKRILLIEDNPDIRENTAEILELANYMVTTAANGKTGVELAFKEKPDLIICDIMMPVLDGYGVLHLLHKNNDLQNIPFIFLSAKSERTDIRKGMEMGADDYITKPFDETELLNAVEGRLKKADLLKHELPSGLEGLHQLIHLAEGDALQTLIEDRNINRYRKKQVIYQEGNRPSRLYYVQKGKVKTYKTNEDGKDLVIGLHNQGDFLGYVALLEGCSYNETAEAMEETELVIVPREDFEKLINNSQDVARRFIKLLAHNVTEKEEKLLGLAYNSLRKKVAEALMILHKKYKVPIDISRENLATIAGTATESLIRTLSDFKSEKLVDIQNGAIVILNERKLGNLLN
jgi:CRP/FNR family cyclic AMP-dependent transcriptional regulator